MAVIMHCPDSINLLLLDPSATITVRSQADALPDDVKVFDAFPTCQGRTKLDTPFHDPDRQIRIQL